MRVFRPLIVVPVSLLAIAAACAEKNVDRFGIFERALETDTAYSNPFTDVTATARVTAPDRTQHTVRCFYDGSNKSGNASVWRFRYMPSQEGTYTFAVESNDSKLNGATGQFRCSASKQKGPLRVATDNPEAVAYASGAPFIPVGDCAFFLLSDQWLQKDRLEWIDAVAAKGVNKVILCMVNDDGPDVIPWEGNADSLDYTRFDLQRMQAWDNVVDRMRECGVIAYLWFYSDDSNRLYPPADGDAEHLYFQYIIARFAAYENVVWNLGLEYREYRDDTWAKSQATFVKHEDPYTHLVAIHQGEDFPGGLLGSDIDVYSSQTRPHPIKTPEEVAEVIRKNHEAAAKQGRPIVFWTEEWCYEPGETERGALIAYIWTSTLQAGGYTIMSDNFWSREGRLNWWNDVDETLATLMGRVRQFSQLRPRNDLAVGGGKIRFVAASSDELLALATAPGTLQLDLSRFEGAGTAEWWNVTTRETQTAEIQMDGTINVALPFSPAVLHIAK